MIQEKTLTVRMPISLTIQENIIWHISFPLAVIDV